MTIFQTRLTVSVIEGHGSPNVRVDLFHFPFSFRSQAMEKSIRIMDTVPKRSKFS